MMHAHANQLLLPFLPPPAQPVAGEVVPFAPVLKKTEEVADEMRRLFDAGLSRALIAEKLGVSKGLVSGKIHREGWTRQETRTSIVPARRPPPAPPSPAGLGLRLEALDDEACHWPTAEDADGVQLFCGAPGHPYCTHHKGKSIRRAYRWERSAMDLPAYAFEETEE